MSDAVIAALQASLLSCPDPVPIRRHLAGLLLAAGRPADALGHCQAILAIAPADVETIGLAADSALQSGNPTLADAYRAMAAAFSGSGTAPMATSQSSRRHTEGARPGPVDASGGTALPFHLVPGRDDSDTPERPSVRLEDVGGMDAVKQRLEISFLGPMRNPQLRAMYGKSLRGGLLLWGPPGCGKTFIARATAGEVGARFIGVGLPDILDMYFGNSERNLHELFERARRSAPCVVFLDELDALGAKRVNMRSQQTWRGLIAQLLSELDGALSDNEGVFMLGATNAPWDVDPALKRPGRFDRTLLVLPPDRAAREAILSFHLRERPVTDLDVGAVAAETEGFSGADLAALAEGAAELALADSISTGAARPIAQHDIAAALHDVRPSTSGWFQTAGNFARFANEGGAYDDLLAYMQQQHLG